MKFQNTSSRLHRNCLHSPIGLISLLLVFISLVGTCEAQSSDVGFTVEITVFVLGCGAFCCIFWTVFMCVMCAREQQKLNTMNSRTSTINTQYIFNLRQQNQISQPQSQLAAGYPVQGYIIPPTHLSSTGGHTNTESQTITTHDASEAVSLPEATLHQDDAPPSYAVAIGMTANAN